MKKLMPHELLRNRRKAASSILQQLAHEKTHGKNASTIYAEVATKLMVSAQTVYNYATKQHDKDGYLMDAIIQELKKIK